MDYKKAIFECLDTLEKSGGESMKEHYQKLRKQVEPVNDPQKLFYMYQTLREVLAKEKGDENAPFKIKTPDGEVVEVKSIEEAQSKLNGYKKTEEVIPPDRTKGRATR